MNKRIWKVLVAFMLMTTICVGLSSAATRDGEIVSVQIEPEQLVGGQTVNFQKFSPNNTKNRK